MSSRRIAPLKYLFALAAFTPSVFGPALLPGSDDSAKILADERIECTTGVASSAATQDGRPLLWKNRDLTGGRDQEFHYVTDLGIPFISITTDQLTGQYYGGVNAVGFAIENSNSYNIGSGVAHNGWPVQSDDGYVQATALATCTTVDDFQALLDSLNELGRTHISNYGVIDAFGGAAIFESAAKSYMRWDAAEQPGGFLVRSNFSYWDNSVESREDLILDCGLNRHNSAYGLFKAGIDSGKLTAEYIFQRVARDMYLWGVDARPLPFDDYYGENPYGCFPTSHTICRESTRSILVVQGVAANESPDDAILWAMCGSPYSAVALPLWVRAGSVPPEFGEQGLRKSEFCNRALELRDYIYLEGDVVNTERLVRSDGKGLWDMTLPLERWVFRKTYDFINSPSFSYDRLATFQNHITRQVTDSLEAWQIPTEINNVVIGDLSDHGIVIGWDFAIEEEDPDTTGSRMFKLYRNNEPFREDSQGELLTTTMGTSFVDTDPIEGTAFYRVESVFR